MLVMIGSEAAQLRGVRLRRKATKDVDFFSTVEKVDRAKLEEAHPGKPVEVLYRPEFARYSWSGAIASLDELYTIKLSHSYWQLKNNSWRKHVRDMAFLKREGGRLIPELHSLLYKVWEELHGKKPANLDKSPEEFFTNSVERIYEHDSIHAAVAYYDGVPLFNRILKDGHSVAVDENKFNALAFSDKLKLVREEVYATALERKLIPSGFKEDMSEAYDYALTKTITSFSKGWFPTFILDNYETLRKPADNFVETFNQNKDLLVKL